MLFSEMIQFLIAAMITAVLMILVYDQINKKTEVFVPLQKQAKALKHPMIGRTVAIILYAFIAVLLTSFLPQSPYKYIISGIILGIFMALENFIFKKDPPKVSTQSFKSGTVRGSYHSKGSKTYKKKNKNKKR